MTGGHSRLVDFRDKRALVLVFIGTTCPAANSYAGLLSRLDLRYRSQGVQLLGIYSHADESLQEIARHAKAYRLSFPAFKDEKQELARQLGARVTPEAFVLDADRAVRYQGRIDDAYAGGIGRRVAPQRGDLEDAVKAVLAGRPVSNPVTKAAGCVLFPDVRPAASPAVPVTYYPDVEPILRQRCQSCHRPGQAAPFSLLTYGDARRQASQIREFSRSRQMPPWLPEPDYGDLLDPRRLTAGEIATLSAWAEAGAPEGVSRDAPPPAAWPEGWTLGKPDLILSIAEPYQVAASGADEFRVFVLPTGLTEDRYLSGVEIRPGNPKVVHHVISLVDSTGQGRELDAEDPQPGYATGPGGVRIASVVLQGIWTPGNTPRFLPPGVAQLLRHDADILLQMHYHKTGKPESDQTRIGLYFVKEPVKRVARTVVVGGMHPDIPADAPHHLVRVTDVMPLDVRLLSIMPHMHFLGKEMRVTAELPDGSRKELVWIRRWDYRWQEAYRFREPPLLPKGTRVELVAFFDNSASNPLNPNRPPRAVPFGELTTNEMASVILEGIPE